jgi:signal transduction histidine kinase
MAWTWSAPQRGNFAYATALSVGAWTSSTVLASQSLSYLGKGDLTRGVCIGAASVLTIAGAAAPFLQPETLTAFLFVIAAISALLVVVRSADQSDVIPDERFEYRSDVGGLNTAKSFDPTPRTFAELLPRACTPSPPNPSIDRAAWARLTAHMSHELRTPLNAVLGFSELMSNEVFGPIGASCYGDYARNIHASGRMLLKSAEDALAITALLTAPDNRGAPVTTCLASAVQEALAFHEHDFAARRISITTDLSPDAQALADPQTVRQMLINLLADCARPSHNDMTIKIAVRAHSERIDVMISGELPVAIDSPQSREASNESFALLLARTLAELSGAQILPSVRANGSVTQVAQFTPATQRDFFSLH